MSAVTTTLTDRIFWRNQITRSQQSSKGKPAPPLFPILLHFSAIGCQGKKQLSPEALGSKTQGTGGALLARGPIFRNWLWGGGFKSRSFSSAYLVATFSGLPSPPDSKLPRIEDLRSWRGSGDQGSLFCLLTGGDKSLPPDPRVHGQQKGLHRDFNKGGSATLPPPLPRTEIMVGCVPFKPWLTRLSLAPSFPSPKLGLPTSSQRLGSWLSGRAEL